MKHHFPTYYFDFTVTSQPLIRFFDPCREISPRETAHKETTHKEKVHKKTAHKEITHKEIALKEIAHKETTNKETAHKKIEDVKTTDNKTKNDQSEERTCNGTHSLNSDIHILDTDIEENEENKIENAPSNKKTCSVTLTKEECRYWISDRGCAFGDRCRMIHSEVTLESKRRKMIDIFPEKRNPCKFFHKPGGCSWGDKCGFKHLAKEDWRAHRKRTKTRSRQKNIKKDNRPDHLKPSYLTPGAHDYIPSNERYGMRHAYKKYKGQ